MSHGVRPLTWSAAAGSIYVEPVTGQANRYNVYTSAQKSCTTSVPDGPLSLGATGDDVARCSHSCSPTAKTPTASTAVFGAYTEAAVVAFQNKVGLPADGTWAAEEATKARAIIAATSGGATWKKVAGGPFAGPIEFRSAATPTAPDTALGLCQPTGSVIHYRGLVRTLQTVVGPRTVNQLPVEDYLRGVVPKEVPASWGSAGGGAGMNALQRPSGGGTFVRRLAEPELLDRRRPDDEVRDDL